MEHDCAALGIQPERRFIANGHYLFRSGSAEQPQPEGVFVFEVEIYPYIPARAHAVEDAQPGTIPELQVVLIDGLRATESHRK